MDNWIDVGSVDELSATPLKRVTVMNREFAVSYKDGTFGVLSNTCNHAGGPLGKGRLDGEYIVCPWHNWKFNAITIRNHVLIRNKVAGFIIVGGQDNIQAVAGHMLGFFAELGFIFPQFPYIAHSRGWSHEDMEHNVEIVRNSKELAEGAEMLAKRCLELAAHLVARDEAPSSIERGGRKAHAVHL